MELSWPLIFKTGASLVGVLITIGMFSELSWPVKLKLTATLLLGIILIGLLAPLGTATEPFGVISVPAFGGAITLAALAVLAGFIGYFISWPYGREIGILAVPSGLAVWAMRCGNMAELMRLNPTLTQHRELFEVLKWEPIFWLVIVAAGFGGVLVGQKIATRHWAPVNRDRIESTRRLTAKQRVTNAIIAMVGSIFIAQFCIGVLARGIRVGSVMAQPAVGQIVFAVLVSFAIAAFLVKRFLDAGYIWPMAASALVTGFVIITRVRQDTLQQLVEHYPPVFFYNAVTSVLPVQMVAFGALGSIAGYWLAIHTNMAHTIRQSSH